MLAGWPGYISLVMAVRVVPFGRRHAPSCHGSGHDSYVTFQGQARIRFRESGGLIGGTGHQPRHRGDLIDARTNRMAKILRRFNMGRHLETGRVGFGDDHRDKSRV